MPNSHSHALSSPLTFGSASSVAFLAVIVNKKAAFLGALDPSAADAEEGEEGDGAGADAFSEAAAAAAAVSLSSRGPADTRDGDERRSKRRASATAARGAIALRRELLLRREEEKGIAKRKQTQF